MRPFFFCERYEKMRFSVNIAPNLCALIGDENFLEK